MNTSQSSGKLLAAFGGIIGSVFLLGGLVWFVSRKDAPPPWGNPVVIVMGCLTIGALWSAYTAYVRRAGPGALAEVAKKSGEDAVLRRIQQTFIAAFALSEAASIFGFVAAMATGSRIIYLPFAIGALASLAFYFPSEEKLRGMTDAAIRTTSLEHPHG